MEPFTRFPVCRQPLTNAPAAAVAAEIKSAASGVRGWPRQEEAGRGLQIHDLTEYAGVHAPARERAVAPLPRWRDPAGAEVHAAAPGETVAASGSRRSTCGRRRCPGKRPGLVV
eukprot:scaffold3811_cov323-Prasinococcus_capsulatus_cf.AAC.1